ncbi:hypothetical protein HNP99_001612 [Flavobacterium sp. 28A]|uniref:phosphoribosyltransferase n=1 Tax=Flavobacterium sp. 28A TaxID=2735895 RepID=UPI001C2D01A1|nr:phosphoribosyltransferase [Flavobacterium sp. 28A]NRT15265.1 hypothetical protein [Flavobacterium sp. 28A]
MEQPTISIVSIIIIIIIILIIKTYRKDCIEKPLPKEQENPKQIRNEDSEALTKVVTAKKITSETTVLEIQIKLQQEQQKEIQLKNKIKLQESQRQKELQENIILEPVIKYKAQFQNKFIINKNSFLNKDITGYYHSEYLGGQNWQVQGTLENMIWTLKNDRSPFPNRIPTALEQLKKILKEDLPKILSSTDFDRLTVCVVPRAKTDSNYRQDQLYFRQIIKIVIGGIHGLENGTDFVSRKINTKTTHLRGDQGGDGRMPYIGITKETCLISTAVQGKDILLIDDIYTKSINIDEDAIQALLDHGAKSVLFYSIGKTVSRF